MPSQTHRIPPTAVVSHTRQQHVTAMGLPKDCNNIPMLSSTLSHAAATRGVVQAKRKPPLQCTDGSCTSCVALEQITTLTYAWEVRNDDSGGNERLRI